MDVSTTYFIGIILTSAMALAIYKLFVEDKKKK